MVIDAMLWTGPGGGGLDPVWTRGSSANGGQPRACRDRFRAVCRLIARRSSSLRAPHTPASSPKSSPAVASATSGIHDCHATRLSSLERPRLATPTPKPLLRVERRRYCLAIVCDIAKV